MEQDLCHRKHVLVHVVARGVSSLTQQQMSQFLSLMTVKNCQFLLVDEPAVLVRAGLH